VLFASDMRGRRESTRQTNFPIPEYLRACLESCQAVNHLICDVDMTKLLTAALVLFSTGLLACATQAGTAKARGAHDMGCSEEEAAVVEVPGGAYEVSCNGQKATYVCISTQTSGIVCDRDS
jgi:hypothetical protein